MNSFIAFLLRLIGGAHARWQGCEPSAQQRIYFANHTSHLDAAVLWATLPLALRRKTRPVGALDYWAGNRLRLWVAEKIFHALLIERRRVTVRQNPLRDMLAALEAGDSLIIFPEGTRNNSLEPRPFKSGLYHLAKRFPQAELVPAYLENLNRILPKGEILPVPLLGSVTIGTPLRLAPDESKEAFLERARRAVIALHLT